MDKADKSVPWLIATMNANSKRRVLLVAVFL